MPGFTKCCNEHDICYGTCNKSKMTCDEDFRKCLVDYCSLIRIGKSSDSGKYKV